MLAFWTLRILPRIGSSAWNSESRADLAVPSAESPSTMNSSERSTSLLRQSASLAGSALDSSAFLRRWVSRCWRAARRVLDASTTFSMTRAAPWPCRRPWWRSGTALSSRDTTWLTILVTAGVPSTSLVWPSNCGSARRTVTTAVMPSSTSSLMTSASPALSRRVVLRTSLNVLVMPRSKPLRCVPPLGVAMMLTNDCTLGVVAGAPAHRDVDAERALDVLRRHVALVVEQRDGLGEHVLALQAQHVGDRLVGGQELAELGDAAVVAELLLVRLVAAVVADDDLEAGHQERRLAGPGRRAPRRRTWRP